ncbi:MAG: DUF2508 family protein [Oscillospiraceae bacterium]
MTKNTLISLKPLKDTHNLILSFIDERKNRKSDVKKEQETTVKRNTLLGEIKDIQLQIESVRSCFDMTTDFDLTDAYIMELYALEKKHSYLMKIAKSKEITAF